MVGLKRVGCVLAMLLIATVSASLAKGIPTSHFFGICLCQMFIGLCWEGIVDGD